MREKWPQPGHKRSQHCRLTTSPQLQLVLLVVVGGEKGRVMREEGTEEIHDACGGC